MLVTLGTPLCSFSVTTAGRKPVKDVEGKSRSLAQKDKITSEEGEKIEVRYTKPEETAQFGSNKILTNE